MPASDPKRVESIFLALVAMPEAERATTLRVICDGDEALRREVESLLRFHDAPGEGALDRSPLLDLTAGLVATLEENRLPPRPTAAGFTLQSVLGSGGMGVVYVAQQHRPKRTVALKVIRSGASGEAMLRRFEHEAEVLARLQHPGIAQIFETGVADFGHGPQPFIAMELVPGSNLLEFAQQHHLSVRDRLELVARVCDAVQHAHQRGVIHRDLKPANILVTNESADGLKPVCPMPKILDFGVARVTDADLRATSQHTSVGQLIGTLSYMSPEQVLADPREIDTRSDVYALGVILFELLTERLPLDLSSRSIPEAARAIREDQPARLSAIDRLFRGDIDTIVSKAMEKDAVRRYQSAAELGADLRRYLNNEPIVARRASPMYQFRKFAGRNKAAMGVAAALLLVMVAATIVSVTLALNAAAARDRAIAAGRLAEARAYQAGIAAADAALEKNDTASAQRRLQAVASEFQSNWEWRYLNAQVDDSVATLAVKGSSAVYAARFSPDSSRLAVASFDQMVRIWDVATRKVVATWPGHQQAVTSLAWSPDGTHVVTGSRDREIRIWDAATGSTIQVLRGHDDYVNSVDYSRDGLRIVSASSDGRTCVWDAATGQRVATFALNGVAITCAAFTRRGNQVVTSAKDGGVRIYSLAEPEATPMDLRGHRQDVNWVATSPDGSMIASAGRDGTLRLWHAGNGEALQSFYGHVGLVRSVAFSPNGRMLVSAGDDGTVRLWDAGTGALVIALTGHGGNVSSAEFSPDGTWVVSSSADPIGSVRLWEAPHRPVGALAGHVGIVNRIAFDRAGRRLASVGGDRALCLWDQATAERIVRFSVHDDGITLLTYSPDERTLITGARDGVVRFWDADTLALLNEQFAGGPRLFAPSEDGSHFAASAAGVIDVWDSTARKLVATFNFAPTVVEAVAMPCGGAVLAASLRGGDIQLRDVRSGALLRSFPGQGAGARTMRFSRDGRTLVVGNGGRTSNRSVTLWDVATGELRSQFAGPEIALSSIAISDDCSRVAAGTADGDIWMWDAVGGDEVLVLRGHTSSVTDLAFSPDGGMLASCSGDSLIRRWDTTSAADRFAQRQERQELLAQARPLVERLFSEIGDATKVAASLRSDQFIDESLRHAALQLTMRRRVEALSAQSGNVPRPSTSPSENGDTPRP